MMDDIASGKISPIAGLRKLQEMYEDFIIESEHSKCKLTKCVAMFANIGDCWLMCRDAVPLGYGFILEVEGCDWLSVWAATSKPQYLLEGKKTN